MEKLGNLDVVIEVFNLSCLFDAVLEVRGTNAVSCELSSDYKRGSKLNATEKS